MSEITFVEAVAAALDGKTVEFSFAGLAAWAEWQKDTCGNYSFSVSAVKDRKWRLKREPMTFLQAVERANGRRFRRAAWGDASDFCFITTGAFTFESMGIVVTRADLLADDWEIL